MDNTDLHIIDFVLLTTMQKGDGYELSKNVQKALLNYIFNDNANGFTRTNYARNYLESLSSDDIKRELLKNIVKKHFCAETNGYATLLGSNKTFNDDLSVADSDILLFNSIESMRMESVEYLLNKYPKLISLMVQSFVDSRYFNPSYRVEKLDSKEVLSNECNNLLYKIDTYYYNKEKEKGYGNHKIS